MRPYKDAIKFLINLNPMSLINEVIATKFFSIYDLHKKI